RDVEAYCAKLKRGFAGGRTILAANEVGEALVEWLGSGAVPGSDAPHEPKDRPAESPGGLAGEGGALDEISWGDGKGDELVAGMSVEDLPPIDDDLPPLDDRPLPPPDPTFGEAAVLSLDERVDAIGGRDVFAASDPPPDDMDLQLDLDADMIGLGDQAHYVREDEVAVAARGAKLSVDVDPEAPNAKTDDVLSLGAVDAGFDGDVDVPDSLGQGVPESRASAAPVGRITSSAPTAGADDGADEVARDDLPALTTPPPTERSTSQPLVIGLVVVLLIAAAAVTFVL
ncbi:MAG: hypothetical protein RIF41_37495, partial [Polyangiaceae bacterium]